MQFSTHKNLILFAAICIKLHSWRIKITLWPKSYFQLWCLLCSDGVNECILLPSLLPQAIQYASIVAGAVHLRDDDALGAYRRDRVELTESGNYSFTLQTLNPDDLNSVVNIIFQVCSGSPLLWTPWGPGEVSCRERCPHFRGKFLLNWQSVLHTEVS